MDRIQDIKKDLSGNCSDFWCSSYVNTIDVPSTVEFLRETTSTYHPVIIRGLVEHWPALRKWDLEYLESKCKSPFSVNITPDGRADSIKEVNGIDTFCYPAETSMDMKTFRDMMENRSTTDAVPYLSEQDSNFTKSFPELHDDIDCSIPLADEAFGCLPEATNIWIGDERSVSSMHKDHFENMYVVLSGEKTFTLLPPTDVAFLPQRSFPTLRHAIKDYALSPQRRLKREDLYYTDVDCPSEELTWIDVDIDAPGVENSHKELFQRVRPIRCNVRAGETLYIPAMWYHQVSQTKVTISINFWYEMRFDFRFVFHQLAYMLQGENNESERKDSMLSKSFS